MAKYFTFADRAIPVQFFETEPVAVTLLASDETDGKILRSAELIQQGDKQTDVDARLRKYREAVENLIGADKTREILSRAENADGFAALSVYQYLLSCYRDGKAKNLMASGIR